MKKSLAVSACLVFMSSFASAAIYTWDSGTGMYNSGNQIQGLTVAYDQVASDTGLYGNMQISGDNMWFFPTAFQLESTDPESGLKNLDETLQFTLESKPGGGAGSDRFIESIQFIEYGDYQLEGIGAAETFARVTAPLSVTILERNRSSWFELPIQAYLTFSPVQPGDPADWDLLNDGPTPGTLWQGSLNLDLPYDDITKVQVSLDNKLAVQSIDGSYSYIEKKGVGEAPAVQISPIIPEPATLALLGLGGLLLRRKK